GRFTTVDPLLGGLHPGLDENPFHFQPGDIKLVSNAYKYVLNNPVNHIDPSGMKVFLKCEPTGPTSVRILFRPRHCAVIVCCKDTFIRFDGGGKKHPTPVKGLPQPTEEKLQSCPSDKDLDSYTIESPWLSCDKELQCLKNAKRKLKQLKYNRLGP